MIDNDFLNSVWQHRRVVITKDCISFAFVGNDEEVDRVPLSGVDFVKVFDENISVENHEIQSQNHFCLQVATNPLGYNSGRSYMLRSVSSSSRDEVLVLLSKLSKDAKKRAKAKTGFQKLQLKTKKYYEKDFVQGFIALIIMTVSVTRPASPRLHFVSSSFLIAVSESELLLHHHGGAVPQPRRQPRRVQNCPRPAPPAPQHLLHRFLHNRARRHRLLKLAAAPPLRRLVPARPPSMSRSSQQNSLPIPSKRAHAGMPQTSRFGL